MDYKRIYDALVEKAKARGLNKSQHEGYFEIHHIVPRCMGGTNDKSNLVLLSGREHFMAHMLLWKAYPKNRSLAFAANFMSNRDVCKINSYLYEYLQADSARKYSEEMSGKRVKDLTGERFTRLVVTEQADFYYPPGGGKSAMWICQCDCGNMLTVVSGSLTSKNTQSCGCLTVERGRTLVGENNPFYGKKHTEETKEKFKLRRVLSGPNHPSYGKKFNEEQRKAMGDARRGIPWTDAQRESIMAGLKRGEDHHMFGKKHTEEALLKMSESQKARNVRPWENQSTQTEESMVKWALCDYYYELWVQFNKPGLKVFTKIYNEIHNDSVSLSYFTNPRLNWLKGWIPQEDQEWKVFKDNMLEC